MTRQDKKELEMVLDRATVVLSVCIAVAIVLVVSLIFQT